MHEPAEGRFVLVSCVDIDDFGGILKTFAIQLANGTFHVINGQTASLRIMLRDKDNAGRWEVLPICATLDTHGVKH